MGQIKEHIDKFEKSKKLWVRIIRWFFALMFILLLIGFLADQAMEMEEQKVDTQKYHVRVSNTIGGHSYYCEYYTLDGSTYKLFNSDSTLTNEITITDGYVIEINLSEND